MDSNKVNEQFKFPDLTRYNTVPKLFQYQVECRAGEVTIWRKQKGIWESITWGEYGGWSQDIGNGLIAVGLNSGDKVSILSQTRAEWVVADMAIMSIGCVTVPIYHSNTDEQVKYIVNHSDSKVVFVDDQEQLDKILTVRDDLPLLKKIIVMDKFYPKDIPGVVSMSDFRRMGKEYRDEYPEYFTDRMNTIRPDDIISFIYTSGTTGHPKAAMISSNNVIAIIKHLPGLLNIHSNDTTIAYLPLAHIAERDVGHFMKLISGNQTIFAESMEDLPQNLRQTGPTIMFGTPRVFEKFYAKIATAIDDATRFQQRIYNWAVQLGKSISEKKINGKEIPVWMMIKNYIALFLIYRKIHNLFGGNIRFLISGGAPISPEIIRYFHCVGLDIYEVYGMTETTGLISVNRPNKMKIGSTGQIFPDTEVRIEDDGEIISRGHQNCIGYYKNDYATRELLESDENGRYWLHTGDIGYIDEDGYLFITDRKKDIIITAGGKNVAPQNIENLMKTSPYISQAMVYGDRKPYLTALLTLDEDEITKFARDRKILYQDLPDLSKKEAVVELIGMIVRENNSLLASYESIKKYRILPEDFNQDKDEITPTLKVKRKIVTERYKNLLEEMYL